MIPKSGDRFPAFAKPARVAEIASSRYALLAMTTYDTPRIRIRSDPESG